MPDADAQAPAPPEVPGDVTVAPDEPAPPPRPARAVRVLVIAAVITLTALGFVTTALTPAIAAKNPLLLIALEAPARNMLLARRVPVALFIAVAATRRFIPALLYFFIGRWYGDAAVRWAEKRAGKHGSTVRRAESAVRAAAYPAVFFLPVPLVSIIAGSMRMPVGAFVGTSAAGCVTVAALFRGLGHALARPVDAVLDTFSRNALPATVVTVVAVCTWGLWKWYSRRRGRGDGVP